MTLESEQHARKQPPMPKLTNPNDIARETFKQLAAQRVAPTPENYRRIYHEITETAPDSSETEKELIKALLAAGRDNPQQAITVKTIVQAIEQSDWKTLTSSVTALAAQKRAEQTGWADLIRDLIRQWDLKQTGLSTPRKKEALDRVLINFGKNPDEMLSKLRSLVKAWSEGSAGSAGIETEGSEPQIRPAEASLSPEGRVGASMGPLSNEAEPSGMLVEWLSQALLHGVMPRIAQFPELAQRAAELASEVRAARDVDTLNKFSKNIRQFWIELELRADADREVLDGLMRLLRLLITNITELVLDDQWLRGQLTIMQDIMNAPLNPRVIAEAEQRFKEVIFKQGTLKHSLNETKASLKNLVAVFIARMGEMSDSTSVYHQKIDHYAGELSDTEDLPTINKILQAIISDTKNMHLDMVRSHDDLLHARRQADEAEQKMRELETELGQISELIYQDHLTGALNRRGMEEAFVREFARAERSKTHLALALLDIDHFKKINDTFGHDAGDQALVHLTNVIKEILRPVDIVARFGGEEFLIILPDTSAEEGVSIMTRLQRNLTKRFFLHDNTKVLITFSAGVAQRIGNETSEAMIARADDTLYRAKQAGRNRVLLASTPTL